MDLELLPEDILSQDLVLNTEISSLIDLSVTSRNMYRILNDPYTLRLLSEKHGLPYVKSLYDFVFLDSINREDLLYYAIGIGDYRVYKYNTEQADPHDSFSHLYDTISRIHNINNGHIEIYRDLHEQNGDYISLIDDIVIPYTDLEDVVQRAVILKLEYIKLDEHHKDMFMDYFIWRVISYNILSMFPILFDALGEYINSYTRLILSYITTYEMYQLVEDAITNEDDFNLDSYLKHSGREIVKKRKYGLLIIKSLVKDYNSPVDPDILQYIGSNYSDELDIVYFLMKRGAIPTVDILYDTITNSGDTKLQLLLANKYVIYDITDLIPFDYFRLAVLYSNEDYAIVIYNNYDIDLDSDFGLFDMMARKGMLYLIRLILQKDDYVSGRMRQLLRRYPVLSSKL